MTGTGFAQSFLFAHSFAISRVVAEESRAETVTWYCQAIRRDCYTAGSVARPRVICGPTMAPRRSACTDCFTPPLRHAARPCLCEFESAIELATLSPLNCPLSSVYSVRHQKVHSSTGSTTSRCSPHRHPNLSGLRFPRESSFDAKEPPGSVSIRGVKFDGCLSCPVIVLTARFPCCPALPSDPREVCSPIVCWPTTAFTRRLSNP